MAVGRGDDGGPRTGDADRARIIGCFGAAQGFEAGRGQQAAEGSHRQESLGEGDEGPGRHEQVGGAQRGWRQEGAREKDCGQEGGGGREDRYHKDQVFEAVVALI